MWLRMVKTSSNACVGCACRPIARVDNMRAVVVRQDFAAAPAQLCRSTMTSVFIASILLSVSCSVSPLTELEEEFGNAHGVGAKALGGQFERDTGAGTGFVEPVHHQASLEKGNFLNTAFACRNSHKLWGGIQDKFDLLA